MPLAADREDVRSGDAAGGARRIRAALALHAPALAAAAAGVAWFGAHVGLSILDPTRVAWLLHDDLATNYLGWAFFRSAPFSLPLGANPSFPWPLGSSLAYTDSIPLVGVLMRPLAPLLPEQFQYVGPWLGLCFALQGYVGAKLVRLVSPVAAVQALGGALFALAPPLLHRVVGPNTGHASLCAHWLVLSLLWLALAPADASRVRRRLLATGALVLVSSGLHPYHTMVTVALSGALLVRFKTVDRVAGWGTLVVSGAAFVAAAATGLLAFGHFTSGVRMAASGFGFYSSDALSLVNPMRWSRFWEGLPVGPGQYEGFGYLGAGVLALAAAGAGSAVHGRRLLAAARWRAALPALAVAGLLAVFALSDTITVAGTRIGHVGAYAWVPALGSTFRSSGRFLWSLHYVAVLGAIAAITIVWRSRPRLVVGALATAVAVQVADVRPPVPMLLGEGWASPTSDAWAAARGRYRHVAIVPPFLVTGAGQVSSACPVAFGRDDYVWPAEVAYRLPATLNSANLSRMDPVRATAACAELAGRLASRRLDSETIYVVHPAYVKPFLAAGAICGLLDGMLACVDGARKDPFAQALRAAPAG